MWVETVVCVRRVTVHCYESSCCLVVVGAFVFACAAACSLFALSDASTLPADDGDMSAVRVRLGLIGGSSSTSLGRVTDSLVDNAESTTPPVDATPGPIATGKVSVLGREAAVGVGSTLVTVGYCGNPDSG